MRIYFLKGERTTSKIITNYLFYMTFIFFYFIHLIIRIRKREKNISLRL